MSEETRHRMWLITPLVTLLAAIGVTIALPLADPIAEPAPGLLAPAETTVSLSAADDGALRPGVTAETITVGVLGALTGDEAAIGRNVVDGHYLFWESMERYGGVGGYEIEILVRDGGLDPSQAVGAYEMLSSGAAIVSSSIGTAMIAEDALADGMVVVADSPVSAWADIPNIAINAAQASFAAEMWVGASWALEQATPRRDGPAGILYQDDEYGEDCLSGYRAAITDLGLVSVALQSYDNSSDYLHEQVAALSEAGAEVVYLCADPLRLGQFIVAAEAAGYSPTVIATSGSYSPHLVFALGAGEYGDWEAESAGLALLPDLYVVSPVPAYESDLPGMAEFRRAVEDGDIAANEIDFGLWFGYTQAATAHAILSTAVTAGDLSRAGIAAAFVDTTGVDFGCGKPPSGYGETSAERVPSTTAAVFRPVSLSERVFGLEPVTEWITAP